MYNISMITISFICEVLSMKKCVCTMLSLILLFSLCACGKEVSEQGVFEDASIILNEYDKISDEDWKEVLSVVESVFETWPGFVMHYIEDIYVGNDTTYCNMLSDGVEFEECIILKSSFTTGEEDWSGFSANTTYDEWMWYLARTKDGEWRLVENGVC